MTLGIIVASCLIHRKRWATVENCLRQFQSLRLGEVFFCVYFDKVGPNVEQAAVLESLGLKWVVHERGLGYSFHKGIEDAASHGCSVVFQTEDDWYMPLTCADPIREACKAVAEHPGWLFRFTTPRNDIDETGERPAGFNRLLSPAAYICFDPLNYLYSNHPQVKSIHFHELCGSYPLDVEPAQSEISMCQQVIAAANAGAVVVFCPTDRAVNALHSGGCVSSRYCYEVTHFHMRKFNADTASKYDLADGEPGTTDAWIHFWMTPGTATRSVGTYMAHLLENGHIWRAIDPSVEVVTVSCNDTDTCDRVSAAAQMWDLSSTIASAPIWTLTFTKKIEAI